MKKLLVVVLLVFVVFSLVACGGNGGDTLPVTVQGQAGAQTEAGVAVERPSEYYTFGDSFIYYSSPASVGGPHRPLEITFGAEPTFTVVDYIPEQLSGNLRNVELIYGRTFIRIPVTVTNLHDDYSGTPFLYMWGTRLILPDGTQSFRGGHVRDDDPTTGPLDNVVGAVMTILANVYGEGRVDVFSAGAAPGESVEAYLHIWYTGDRDYVLRVPQGGEWIYLVFPVTMP